MINTNILIKEPNGFSSMSISNIAKSIAICYGLTIILLAIFAIIVTYTPFPEVAVPTGVLLITILSVALSGILVARTAQSRGWFCGAISGLTYITTLYILGSLVFQCFSFGLSFLSMLLIGALSGAFGGIVGVNTRR